MSYKIIEKPAFTLVQLIDEVSALDLLKSHEDPQFLDALEAIPTVIYDYSGANSVEMTEQTASHLAELANRIAQYHSILFIIVVPMDPKKTTRVNRYRSTVTALNVKVEIAADLAEAKELAYAFFKTLPADEQ